MARNVSDDPSAPQGGDIGFVKKSDLLPTLREAVLAVFSQARSPLSCLRRTACIYLKLIEVKKADVIPYDEVKKSIGERMMMEESNKRYRDYIEKIKKSSYIEVKI